MSSSQSVEGPGEVPFIPHPEKETKKHPLGEGETLRTNIDRTVSELLTCVESFRREPSMSEKKEILEKKIRPMVSTLRTITAPTSEEKQESGAPEKAAEETKKTIQETIKAVEKAVTDEIETHFSATEITDRTDHEKMITFMRSAHGWLAELHDDLRIPLALRMAAFYGKQNDIGAAIRELKKLVPQFTEDLKREFQKLKESPTQTGLFLFQDHLRSATPQATPSLSEEALRQTPVMENILAHLKDPRQLMQVSKTLKAAVQADLTEEQVEAYAKNILSAKGAGFSLVTAAQICRQNRVIALNAMLKNGLEYQYLSEELKNDIGLVKIAYLSVLKNSPEKIPEFLKQISKDISTSQSMTDFFRMANEKFDAKQPLTFRTIVSSYPGDHDIVLNAVQADGMCIGSASDEFKNNPAIVEPAVRQNGMALQFTTSEFQREHPEIVELAVKHRGVLLRFTTSEFQIAHPEIVELAVRQNVSALKFAASDFQNAHPEIVELAVKRDVMALAFTSSEFQIAHPEIVELAVRQNAMSLVLTTSHLQNAHPDIVKLAVKQNGMTLRFTTSDFQRAHPDIVELAVKQNGMALQFTTSEFQKDNPGIVKLAVEQDGMALQFTTSDFQGKHPEIVALAKRSIPPTAPPAP